MPIFALSGLNADFLALQQAAGQSAVNRLQGELAKMRIIIRRMQINRATTFVGPTYVLLLIRDLDNPFQYDGRTSVDIDLTLVEAILAQVKTPALEKPGA